uniref:CBFD_NFYB_HMF domain-containing protein n=1 Tax=Steinernema glaseri TaxID=37863 RepID=A0A1I7ZUN0_9BILA
MSDTESNFDINLPLGRVKKISRIVPNVRMMSAESIEMLAFAAEQYLKLLVAECVEQAGRRKTVMAKDIDACIMSDHRFKILDGALDGWPEFESTSHYQRHTIKDAFQQPSERMSENPHSDIDDVDDVLREGVDVHRSGGNVEDPDPTEVQSPTELHPFPEGQQRDEDDVMNMDEDQSSITQ